MNTSLSNTRSIVFAACAALVTTIGCGGGGGGSTAPTAPAASTGSDTTGGNGATDNGAGAGTGGSTTPTTPTTPVAHAQHKRCGWIGADTFDAGKKSFLANPDYYDAIHPKWGTLNADTSIKVLPMADDTLVLPGHGPSTTIGRERDTNPYLQGLTV